MMKVLKSLLFGALLVGSCSLFLGSPPAFAFFSDVEGDPPHGLKVEGKAKGIKLSGPLTILFVGSVGTTVTDANVVLQLRHGNDDSLRIVTAQVEFDSLNINNVAAIQTVIVTDLKSGVLAVFGFDPASSVLVKKVEDPASALYNFGFGIDNVTVMDLVLTVNEP